MGFVFCGLVKEPGKYRILVLFLLHRLTAAGKSDTLVSKEGSQ